MENIMVMEDDDSSSSDDEPLSAKKRKKFEKHVDAKLEEAGDEQDKEETSEMEV